MDLSRTDVVGVHELYGVSLNNSCVPRASQPFQGMANQNLMLQLCQKLIYSNMTSHIVAMPTNQVQIHKGLFKATLFYDNKLLLPAFINKVLCSLLELKVLENIWASSRQSSRTNSWDVLRYLNMPFSDEHRSGQDVAGKMDYTRTQ